MSPLLAKRLSDENLGSRLASGEAAAFDELYRRYVHRLAAYGAHLLGDGAAGDDVAQATLLKAYGALRDGRVPDRMKPWLYRIAHNVAIDLVVRRREVPSAELPEEGSSDPEPVAGALVAALAALPDRQRRVYVLRELHGLRIDETAAELSLTAAQVEQSLFAARNRLAEHLVFGDRLNCVAVVRLAAGPLDGDERRALKSHLRSCAGCRSGLGLRGRALSVLPVTSLEWFRGLVAGAAGGGAPVVAKVGAAVATVTFAAGVPVAALTAHHQHRARVQQLAHLQPTLRAVPARVVGLPVETVALSRAALAPPKADGSPGVRQRSGRVDGESGVPSADTTRGHDGGGAVGSSGTDGSNDGHGGDGGVTISSSDRAGSDSAGSGGRSAPTVLAAPVASHDGSGSDGLRADSSGGSSGGGGASSADSSSHDGGGSGDGGGGGDGGGDPTPTTTDPSISD